MLSALGIGATAAIAGCLDASGEPSYETGDVGDISGDERTADEMTAAQGLATQETTNEVTSLDSITITDHEFVLEDDYMGSTVQGTVENTRSDRVKIVEVRVRVYDADGAQLGQYVDTTGDLEGASAWEFTVVLLESPDDIAEYDIAALGTPT